jgi:hypothetical protein
MFTRIAWQRGADLSRDDDAIKPAWRRSHKRQANQFGANMNARTDKAELAQRLKARDQVRREKQGLGALRVNEYTKDELTTFDRLTHQTGSPDQVTRITARLALRKFVVEHTKEKCDVMFAELQKRDAGK